MNYDKINDKAFEDFPIGTKVKMNGTNVEGVVKAHGWSVQGEGKKLGIKTNEWFGSALEYNRSVSACEVSKI